MSLPLYIPDSFYGPIQTPLCVKRARGQRAWAGTWGGLISWLYANNCMSSINTCVGRAQQQVVS